MKVAWTSFGFLFPSPLRLPAFCRGRLYRGGKCHHVAGDQGVEHLQKLAPVAVRAGHFLAVDLLAARAA